MLKLGIDIGGTTIKGGVFDELSTVPLKQYCVPTNGKINRDAILNQLYCVIDNLLTKNVDFIGISSAGRINPKTGVCVYATDNLKGWTNTNIKGLIEKKYNVPCMADNDAICALKGELTFYKDSKNVTMLTFGTGVGGASLVEGNILRGSDLSAGTWGHYCLKDGGNDCNCGKKGCAETYLSATALINESKKIGLNINDTKELFELYKQGHKKAVEIIQEFGKNLKKLICEINDILAPEIILLGGGVANSVDVFNELLNGIGNVKFAQLGNNAGMFGATTLQQIY